MKNKERKKAQMQLAKAKYVSTHRTFTFNLNESEDAEIITFLERQSNKSEVIRRILRKGFEL